MKVNDILVDTVYFGLVMSFLCYWVAMQIRKKLPYPIFNPLLISAIFIISILVIFDIDFDTYSSMPACIFYAEIYYAWQRNLRGGRRCQRSPDCRI